ncbi:unnamed protein product [Ilex paraguariensis]|uniref:Uncharacterized protein n=1 Tax=Ilex paraguariensis TaxID=185542 RepID=A0ABC8UH37_9AQUA
MDETMIMEVQIISKESIKPSSPTPNHLRTFKLSLLDQLIPAPYAPIVLFYPNYDGANHLEVSQRLAVLKQSLSETLTRFYPLAGTIKDDLSIDCCDEGAYYATAQVNCDLSHFLNKPELQLIHKFLPCEANFQGSTAGTRVTNIQVNVFGCGGITIGICISHKIVDGDGLSTFLKGWAGTACGSEVVYPHIMATSLFPTNDLWLRDSSIVMWGSLFKMGKCITRRFVFDASAVATLKAKATSSSVPNPTRVEAVSAFIWKYVMAAAKEKSGTKRPSLLTHLVNLRKRMAPTLFENSLGSLIWIASSKCMAKCDVGLQALVDQVRQGISKINGDFVKKLRSNEGSTVMSKSLKDMGDFGSKEGVDFFGFTSWCNFGFYEADFGWGKPIWVSCTGSGGLGSAVYMNLIVMLETVSGNGIEAWVTLDEQEMEILGSNQELLGLASLDPSPLQLLGNSAI